MEIYTDYESVKHLDTLAKCVKYAKKNKLVLSGSFIEEFASENLLKLIPSERLVAQMKFKTRLVVGKFSIDKDGLHEDVGLEDNNFFPDFQTMRFIGDEINEDFFILSEKGHDKLAKNLAPKTYTIEDEERLES